MKELKFDTFDMGLVADKIVSFLGRNNVKSTTLEYCNSEVDEVLSEVPVKKLKDKLVTFFDEDTLHYMVNVKELNCKFSFKEGEFRIYYPEQLEKELAIFNKELF
ncbi:MAG: hypothetical protein AABX70_04715 [Nanoarchaeota archaeon]